MNQRLKIMTTNILIVIFQKVKQMNRMKYHLVEATSGSLNTEVNECHELTNECHELKSDSNVIDRKINDSEDDWFITNWITFLRALEMTKTCQGLLKK